MARRQARNQPVPEGRRYFRLFHFSSMGSITSQSYACYNRDGTFPELDEGGPLEGEEAFSELGLVRRGSVDYPPAFDVHIELPNRSAFLKESAEELNRHRRLRGQAPRIWGEDELEADAVPLEYLFDPALRYGPEGVERRI